MPRMQALEDGQGSKAVAATDEGKLLPLSLSSLSPQSSSSQPKGWIQKA